MIDPNLLVAPNATTTRDAGLGQRPDNGFDRALSSAMGDRRAGSSDRSDRASRPEQSARPDRPDAASRPEAADRSTPADRPARPEGSGRAEQAEHAGRTSDANARPEASDRPEERRPSDVSGEAVAAAARDSERPTAAAVIAEIFGDAPPPGIEVATTLGGFLTAMADGPTVAGPLIVDSDQDASAEAGGDEEAGTSGEISTMGSPADVAEETAGPVAGDADQEMADEAPPTDATTSAGGQPGGAESGVEAVLEGGQEASAAAQAAGMPGATDEDQTSSSDGAEASAVPASPEGDPAAGASAAGAAAAAVADGTQPNGQQAVSAEHRAVVDPRSGRGPAEVDPNPAGRALGHDREAATLPDTASARAREATARSTQEGAAGPATTLPHEATPGRQPTAQPRDPATVDGPDGTSAAAHPGQTAPATSAAPAQASTGPNPSAMVARVMRAVATLENQPPPRTVTLEFADLDGLRLEVTLKDGAVHVTAHARSDHAPGLQMLQRDLGAALAERGFDLGGFTASDDEASGGRSRGRGQNQSRDADPETFHEAQQRIADELA